MMFYRVHPTRWAAPALDPHGRGALILNLRDGTWTHLNPTATAYWVRAVNEGRTHTEAVAAMADQLGICTEQLDTDLAPLLADLRRRRLITMRASS